MVSAARPLGRVRSGELKCRSTSAISRVERIFDELGGDLAQFHDHQFGNPESNVVILEQLLDAVWIAYDDAGDGGIG